MKKLLFPAAAYALILLASCSNDEEQPMPPTVTGTWKLTKEIVISGKDNSILTSSSYNACESKSNFIFTNEGNGTYSWYDLNGSTCELETSKAFSYTYNDMTKTLTFTYDSSTTESYVLNLLTDVEMQIITDTGDHDNDGIDDKLVIVLNK